MIANDPTQVFKNLSNETENLSRAFGESLMPVVIPVVKALTEITEAATDFVNSPIGQTALIFAGIALAAKGAAVALIAAKAGFIAAGGAAVIFGAAMGKILIFLFFFITLIDYCSTCEQYFFFKYCQFPVK